jgi:effector-binding domain-containing protein
MEIRYVDERPTATVRTRTRGEDLPEVMGRCFGTVMEHLGAVGVEPAGPPFAAYHNSDMENLDLEVGFPVSAVIAGGDEVQAGTIPGGHVAVGLHTGPYDQLDETYEKLTGYITGQGLHPEQSIYEFYLNDPGEVEPAQLQTEVYIPLRA